MPPSAFSFMPRLSLTAISILAVFALAQLIAAQQARVYRVGVVLLGGLHFSTVNGLRDGLRELGLEEGKQFVLEIRDGHGDLKWVEAAARSLEEEKVDLIVAITTSATLAAKRATKSVPIVFYTGTDPVSSGLVESFRKAGGRLTGSHGQSAALVAKRLGLLKEMIPKLRRVVTFYRPDSAAAQQSVNLARDAARKLKLELVERPIASVEELRAGLRALRPEEADALLHVADAVVNSQMDLIIESASAKRLPTMLQEPGIVAKGALAAYGESFYTIGRNLEPSRSSVFCWASIPGTCRSSKPTDSTSSSTSRPQRPLASRSLNQYYPARMRSFSERAPSDARQPGGEPLSAKERARLYSQNAQIAEQGQRADGASRRSS